MNLQLSLKKQWFEMTKAGIKTEDYREINPYWLKRLFRYLSDYPLLNERMESIITSLKNGEITNTCEVWAYFGYNPKQFTTNTMTLGCPKLTDTERILKLEHRGIKIGYGKPEWGADPNKLYFIIKHGKILN